ncbi:tyrosine-type recombinase/integrase [Kineosporia babensis]|uniref:Site-specific integrase n=1 Tax=Kineosporia babensis TaxID=499548 RepID=A0A9X1NKF7_9ACTN|nr:site-specific integrase [Kineosporia babensis]MCD5315803.1 site-specific integrase [Kineosporia babensis]
MGYLEIRTGRNGRVTYRARYRDIHGRLQTAGTYTNEREADRAWQRAENLSGAARIGDPRRGRVKFGKYIEETWFPNHVIEASTRENYRYTLDAYILPELGDMRIGEILPNDIREWIVTLQGPDYRLNPPTIRVCKVIVDAIFTTAFNDHVTIIHPGKGVKTPPLASRPKEIITAEQFDEIYRALPNDFMRLLVETDIESGLRWGELTELRAKDLNSRTGMLTVSRAVVQLTAKDRPDNQNFVVKEYPKDREWRRFRIASHLADKLAAHITAANLGPDDLLFTMPVQRTARRNRPAVLPDPESLGRTEPNAKDRTYLHGTCSAYTAGKCRCQFCRDAMATYRAERRATNKDSPRTPRTVATDGHIGRGWFRNAIWIPTLSKVNLGFNFTPHGLRHAHASWLLNGGADLQVVKERLGHASITTTEKYLHTLPTADETALDALDAVRRPTREASPSAPNTATATELAELHELRQTLAKVRQLHEALGLKP